MIIMVLSETAGRMSEELKEADAGTMEGERGGDRQ